MLDATDAMFARLTTSTPDRLKRIRQEGGKTKSTEEAASQTRLAHMWADENRRRQEWASAQAERQRQERRIMALAIGLLALVVIVAIIIAIVGRSTPPPVF